MKRRNFIQMSTNASLGIPSLIPNEVLSGRIMDGKKREKLLICQSVQDLKQISGVSAGDWIKTLGFHTPGDGGEALYHLQVRNKDSYPNEADIILLNNGLNAILKEQNSINYKMFGARCDGISDDGVQIKMAHEYANRHLVPVVNLSGEFWITKTNNIIIKTSVQWGRTVFHIDERFNVKAFPRFVIQNDNPSLDLSNDLHLKKILTDVLKPGVQIISELAPYAGHLVLVQDAGDRIGIRAGYEGNRGWAREEIFYVEEEGRIIGDIAWEFNNLTSITLIPCNTNYLVIEGGCFYFSGDSPENSTPGYHQHGIAVRRSRTIIREQWMGLEPGKKDRSVEPRSGFYTLQSVFDVTLENIRAIPWEKQRQPPEPVVEHGTYGISGARMLNCSFRNLIAEGGRIAWGFFGTNLNKNFRLENCQLNRIDVHFHCWNLYINNCRIGIKGISLTGGGDLFINETVRYGNTFISFRPDYGAKWNGPVRLRGCTLKPSGNGSVSVIQMQVLDFDHQYPISLGSSIIIEDLCIDYSAAPASASPCWLMNIPSFSVNSYKQRLLFPNFISFHNIQVKGRKQGVRLIRITDPADYFLENAGGCDDSGLKHNCTLVCDNIQLESFEQDYPSDDDKVHLIIRAGNDVTYNDPGSLYLKIIFRDCENVCLYLSKCAVNIFLERCSINGISAFNLRGELNFNNCSFQPIVKSAETPFYIFENSLGTSFTNCMINAPVINGEVKAQMIDNISFIKVNKSLRHGHLNTMLGPGVLKYFRENGISLTPAFVRQLMVHHKLEDL